MDNDTNGDGVAQPTMEDRAMSDGQTKQDGSGAGLSTSPSKALLGCVVCDADFCFRWTDTHGVGVCSVCGAPYRILHYDGDKRVEKPPECQLLPEWIAICRQYFSYRRSEMFTAKAHVIADDDGLSLRASLDQILGKALRTATHVIEGVIFSDETAPAVGAEFYFIAH